MCVVLVAVSVCENVQFILKIKSTLTDLGLNIIKMPLSESLFFLLSVLAAFTREQGCRFGSKNELKVYKFRPLTVHYV